MTKSNREFLFVPVVLLVLLLTGAAAATAADPPRPLTERALDNLMAFTRLLSLVRFFHPSDAVATADWNRVAVAGVAAVEDAADPQSLAAALEGFFRPLAPTLRVRPRGSRFELPAELRPPADGRPARIVVWRHLGGAFNGNPKLYTSQRIDDHRPPGYGTLAQEVAPAALRGKKVRLRAWVRAEVEPGGRAQLGLRVDRAGSRPGFFDNMEDRPIHDPAWRTYEIQGEVAPDAERIVVMLVLTGAGKVWLDDVTLEEVNGSAQASLANAALDVGFPDLQPPGWYFPYESIRDGYHLASRRGEECRRGGCAEMFSDEIASPHFPRPEEVLETDLGGGVVAALPVALYADDQGTLPHREPGAPAPAWTSVDPARDSRASRLAGLALAWGILQHFHPQLQPEDPSWAGALRPALAAAAVAADREAFLNAARRFLVPLRDCRASLSVLKGDPPHVLPLAWEWIEDRLVITGVAQGIPNLLPGDTVAAIDGRPAAEAIAEEEALVSAATPEARRSLAIEDLLFDPPTSAVKLRLDRAGNPIEATVTRVPWTENLLPAGTPLAAVDEPRPGIFYVDLARVPEDGLPSLMSRLAPARGVVFDIRRGTNFTEQLLSYLSDRTLVGSRWQTPMVTAPDHRGVLWMATAVAFDPRAPRLKGRIAFLADSRTDFFTEHLLSIVEAYRLGEIVGARSGGCSGMINRSELPGGYRLLWTGRRTLKRDGTILQGAGVEPTVPAARTVRGVATGRDEVVDRAVEVLSKASGGR